jgi:hypothetical protein
MPPGLQVAPEVVGGGVGDQACQELVGQRRQPQRAAGFVEQVAAGVRAA